MKEKFLRIFLALLFGGAIIYLGITGVMELTNKKDLHTADLTASVTLMELEHSINGLIPIGTDYYYLGLNENTAEAYIIHAPKSWLGKNFADDQHVCLGK